MTPEEINIIRTRYCSISPRKMQDILSCSAAAYKLVQDIPVLLAEVQNLQKKTESGETVLIPAHFAKKLENAEEKTICGMHILEYKG